MSAERISAPRRRPERLLSLLWLLLVWLALWGSVTPVLVASGLLVAVTTVVVFPLRECRPAYGCALSASPC